jgi:hypothetical protein
VVQDHSDLPALFCVSLSHEVVLICRDWRHPTRLLCQKSCPVLFGAGVIAEQMVLLAVPTPERLDLAGLPLVENTGIARRRVLRAAGATSLPHLHLPLLAEATLFLDAPEVSNKSMNGLLEGCDLSSIC